MKYEKKKNHLRIILEANTKSTVLFHRRIAVESPSVVIRNIRILHFVFQFKSSNEYEKGRKRQKGKESERAGRGEEKDKKSK